MSERQAARSAIPNRGPVADWRQARRLGASRRAGAVRASAPAALLAKAGLLRVLRRLRLVFALVEPDPGQGAVGPRAQIDVDVLEIAHHVAVGAERGHQARPPGDVTLAALNGDCHEVVMLNGLQRVDQRRGIARAFAVRAVADVAFGMIAPVARI